MATDSEHSWPKQDDWDLYSSEVNNDITPVGGIVAWLKSFTNTPTLPSNWAECDGSVISDSDSPIDGQTLPNLNGTTDDDKLFLRGNTTSGGTGGVATATGGNHSHGLDIDRGGRVRGDSGSSSARDAIYSNAANLDITTVPPYYEVVYIMRIK